MSLRYCWFVLAPLLAGVVFVACSASDTPFGRSSPTIRWEQPVINPAWTTLPAIPPVSCIDRIREQVVVRVAARLGRGRLAEQRKSGPVGSQPIQLIRVLALGGGFAAVDAGNHQVTVLNRDLQPLGSWRVRTEQSDRARHVRAIAAAAAHGDTLWVADAVRSELTALDVQGRVLAKLAIARGAEPTDVAVGGAGQLYVAYPALHESIRAKPERSFTLVAVYRSDGRRQPDLVRVTAADLTPPRFVSPITTLVGVSALGNRVAVFFPESGVIDLYDGYRRERSIRACVPAEVEAGYAAQRTIVARGQLPIRKSIMLLSDVLLSPTGAVAAVGALPSAAGLHHIDLFRDDGVYEGSIAWGLGMGVAELLHAQFAGSLGFARRPEELALPISPVAFSRDGAIAHLVLNRDRAR